MIPGSEVVTVSIIVLANDVDGWITSEVVTVSTMFLTKLPEAVSRSSVDAVSIIVLANDVT